MNASIKHETLAVLALDARMDAALERWDTLTFALLAEESEMRVWSALMGIAAQTAAEEQRR